MRSSDVDDFTVVVTITFVGLHRYDFGSGFGNWTSFLFPEVGLDQYIIGFVALSNVTRNFLRQFGLFVRPSRGRTICGRSI